MAARREKRSAKTSEAPVDSSSPAKCAKGPAKTASKEAECTDDYWDELWKNEKDVESCHPGSEPSSVLLKHVEKIEGEKEKEEVRVLVPLCGISADLKWLAEQGHQVVGIEKSPTAAQRFFDKFKIKHSVEKKEDFNVFTADDLPLKIYQGDFFKFTSVLEPKFDAVWDSHAMHVFDKKDQKRYVDILKDVLFPEGRCLFDSMIYDLDEIPDGFMEGPHPHLITAEDLQKLFGKEFQLEELESEEKSMDWGHMSGRDKETKGHGGDDKGKGKVKDKHEKAKGHGHDHDHYHGENEWKYTNVLFLMYRKPSKK